MTHVTNYNSNLENSNSLKEYMAQENTYDNDVIEFYVEAYSPQEASDKAARMVPDADYINIYLFEDSFSYND